MMLGVTYSEFDNTLGPKLQYQWPPGLLSDEDFEKFSYYVIVSKELTGKAITVRSESSFQYVNYSVAIEDSKYHRNTLLFSLGIILPLDVPTCVYEPVLRKMSAMLVDLEHESEFLFKEESKQQLRGVLRSLYTQLNSTGRAYIQIDEANVLCLQLFRSPPPAPRVDEWDVPILDFPDSRSCIAFAALSGEVSLNHVLPFIDGVRTVRRIAAAADLDVEVASKCVRLLLWYGVARCTDSFQVSPFSILGSFLFHSACNQRPFSLSSLLP